MWGVTYIYIAYIQIYTYAFKMWEVTHIPQIQIYVHISCKRWGPHHLLWVSQLWRPCGNVTIYLIFIYYLSFIFCIFILYLSYIYLLSILYHSTVTLSCYYSSALAGYNLSGIIVMYN